MTAAQEVIMSPTETKNQDLLVAVGEALSTELGSGWRLSPSWWNGDATGFHSYAVEHRNVFAGHIWVHEETVSVGGMEGHSYRNTFSLANADSISAVASLLRECIRRRCAKTIKLKEVRRGDDR